MATSLKTTVATNCRIAIAAPSAPPAKGGGVASAHYQLYRGLIELGWQAELLAFNEVEKIPDEPGVRHAGTSSWLRSVLGVGCVAWLKFRGSNAISHQVQDIICSQPGALQMYRRLKRFDPDLLIIPDRGAPGLFLQRSRAKVVQVVHHIPKRFLAAPLKGEFCPVDIDQATALEQRTLRNVDAIVCPSEYIARVFRQTYRFDGEVKVIPNAIDWKSIERVESRDVRQHLKLAAVSPVVYIPSAGSHLKGAKYVAEIVASLAMAQDGPVGFYLSGAIGEKLACQLRDKPENAFVYAPGMVSQRENIALLKSCSFGISPTLIENFSMALLEAGCCGVPMVTFDVGGNRELIADGKTGFMVPCGDLDGLINSAVSLFQPDLQEAMGAAAREHVCSHFNAARIAEEYLAFFAQLR